MTAVAGVVMLVLAVGAFGARYAPVSSHPILYVVIAAPYLMLLAPAALIVLAWGRHWALGALTGCVIVALVAVEGPSYVATTPEPSSVSVRVMTANLLFGQADSQSVTAIAESSADVVMLQELDPAAVERLTTAGMDDAFPYRALDARKEAAGVGLYSRYPIAGLTKIGGYELAMVSARIRVAGVAREATVMSVHLDAPWPQPIGGWQRDIALLPSTLADQSAKTGDGAVIVGGDFNSTIDMRPFRRLLTNGYRDAAQQAGNGRSFTYPGNRGFPPFLGIDHVLTRNATAVSTSTVELPGSDHRALLTKVMVPTG